MKKNYPDMRILDETDKYFIGHIYEDAFLVEKSSGQEVLHDDFYGDPKCGLISKTHSWAIIAGEHLTIWRKGETTKINKEEIRWVHSMRSIDDQIVEILVDPWADNSSIWALDISNLQLTKLRDFNDYKEKEYSDNIVW